jgi:hypothetical protein
VRALAALLAALALWGCQPADPAVPGTVSLVLAAPEPEEPWEDTRLGYEDPTDDAPRDQVVVRLDDGSEVTVLYAGPRILEPGERVRVYLGERSAFLL